MKRSISVLFACIIAFLCIGGKDVGAKMKWDYKGVYVASCYTAASNTPAGSHKTKSGHRATEGRTIAVDSRNPIAKMGQKVKLKWRDNEGQWKTHVYRVEDVGGFGHCNNGRRAVDVFFEYHGWGLRTVKIYVYRKETKKERRIRIRKKRKRLLRIKLRKQKEPFRFVFDPHLFPWQVVTDKKVISGGVIRVGRVWLDVVGHKKGLDNVIKTGNRCCYFGKWARLKDIAEEAVG